MKNLIRFEKVADESVKIQTPLFEETFSKEDFEPVEDFLTDVCSLIEYSKLHTNSFDRQMFAYHLESFNNLKSELKENLMPVLESSLEYFRKNIERTYGKDNVDFIVSQFVQSKDGKVPKNDHSQRVLATIEDTGKLADDSTEFDRQGACLKYCFSIAWILFLFYVIVWVFQIDVYKDSLVYSKFLSAKKK